MAESKESHYWTQLQAALTAGHWDSPTPARTPKGYNLSWSELFRKFRKHSSKQDVPEAALQTHFLALLLKSTKLTAKEIEATEDSPSSSVFALGNECMLFEERKEDAENAYGSLKQLQSADDTVKLALAYFAFSLGYFRECLDHVSGLKFAEVLRSLQPTYSEKPTLLVTSAEERNQQHSTLASRASNVSFSESPTEVEAANAWLLMEAVRASCLEGMANEKLSPGSPSPALDAYNRGVVLLKAFVIPKSLPTRPGGLNPDSFTRYRELWRWTERLLWRSIILASQHINITHTVPLLRLYATHSGHWSATFKASHRQTVSTLYIRALIMLSEHLPPSLFTSKATWASEIRSVINEYRMVLDATTRFPHAGERNILVEEFVDFCVAAWESGGGAPDQAVWVIDILWWATRLTFNCPRILRHMTRLLHVSGDHELAARVLRLYVQIVGREYETNESQNMRISAGAAEPTATETDLHWVATLVQGSRMLCRINGGVEEAKEAVALIVEARKRAESLPADVRASIDLADGICKSILALRELRPSSRTALFNESIKLLISSVTLNPTSSAHFHLAMALSRSTPNSNLEEAIQHCRLAVEGDSKNIRFWHLLALLEAKVGEWAKAKGVLEAAIDVADDVEFGINSEELKQAGVNSKDFAEAIGSPSAAADDAVEDEKTPTAEYPSANGNAVFSPPNGIAMKAEVLVEPSALQIPPAADLFKPLTDYPPPTPGLLFEHAIQLRMSQLALAELVEGPECVEVYWLDVFDWYSQRRNTDAQLRSATQSVDVRPDAGSQGFLDPTASSIVTGKTRSSLDSTNDSRQSQGNTPSGSTTASTIISPHHNSLEVSAPASLSVGSSNPPSPTKTTTRMRSKLLTRARSQSPGREREGSTGKRVQKMLKTQVHNTQARINTISRKIGHGMSGGVRMSLQRSTSAPNFHEVLTKSRPYQASSIHSRKRKSWVPKSHRANNHRHDMNSMYSDPPPVPPVPPHMQEAPNTTRPRTTQERRLLSDLWLMSAATFRRLDKLDQTRGAIQEAEALDEENAAVWVQLGLYFISKGEEPKAIEAFQKALFIAQDDVSATIHLTNIYLTSQSPTVRSSAYGAIDLAVGMLKASTKGSGWDVSEAWYLLAKAYRLQGQRVKERECLILALNLAEFKGVRDIGAALGWCL